MSKAQYLTLLGLSITNAILLIVFVVFYFHVYFEATKPENIYFATTTNGKIIPIESMNKTK